MTNGTLSASSCTCKADAISANCTKITFSPRSPSLPSCKQHKPVLGTPRDWLGQLTALLDLVERGGGAGGCRRKKVRPVVFFHTSSIRVQSCTIQMAQNSNVAQSSAILRSPRECSDHGSCVLKSRMYMQEPSIPTEDRLKRHFGKGQGG